MLSVLLLLPCLASAAPLSSVDSKTHPTSTSQFSKLSISLLDPSTDFPDSPVNNLQLDAIHVGAGLNAPIPSVNGSTFFATTNHTVQLAMNGLTYPYTITMSDQPEEGDRKVYDLGVDVGTGTEGFEIKGRGKDLELRAPKRGEFVVCDTGFEAYAHPKRVVKFVEGRGGEPGNCTAVRLVPLCAEAGEGMVGDGVSVRCFV